ncbi:MAG: glycosyltransferase family A protein, partial [Ectothiorhodospiraceae bacterium]
MAPRPRVSVIVPTRGLGRRAALVRRALESVLSQQGVETIPIVVINGPDRDPGLVADLRRDSRLRLLDVADAGIPDALKAGREAIDTPWFSALDDDDLYLPGALLSRIRALESRPGYGAVVTNGLVRNHGTERLHVPDMA